MDNLSVGGEMSALIVAHKWEATPLGPAASWPQSLRTTVGILLTSRFAMWMSWGPALTFLYNDAYAPTLGIKHGRALGRPSQEVWAEIWPDIGPRIDTVLATGQATWDEALMLFLQRSGYKEETYHTFSYSPLRDDSGRIAGHLCVVSEETVRVISERRLGTLRELAAGLAAASAQNEVMDAVRASLGANRRDLPFTLLYLLDEGGGPPVLAAATGFDAAPGLLERLAGGTATTLWPLQEVAERHAAVTVTDLAMRCPGLPSGAWSDPPTQALAVPINRQGQERPAGILVAGVSPHRILDQAYGDFLGLIAGQIASGLANARAYEAERRRAAELAEIDRAKTAFFSNVSHEFRTPLTLMLGPLQEAIETSGPELAPVLDMALRNAQRLLRLVNTLLDFSRIQADRVQARFLPLDLAGLTVDLASTFRSAMQRAGLTFDIACPPLPEPVYVDPTMWEKIVLNLLSNAFKFTFTGQVGVALRAEAATVVLTVSDTGTGIPADQLDRVFERFHRVEGSRGRSHEGSGIGLALVRDLVALHGGTIAVVSEPGRGSTFTVTLQRGSAHLDPDQQRQDDEMPALAGAGAGYASEAMGWLDGSDELAAEVVADATAVAAVPARILLADDNADMRDYVRRLLQAAGHEVIAVGDGEAALQRLRAEPVDLILSDVMMPRLDGLGLVRAVRDDPLLRELPVVLLSARAGEAARIEGFATQADDYLTKPFSARELLARISTNLEVTRLRRQALRELREAEALSRRMNEDLEQLVAERTAERDRLWELSEDLLVAADYEGRLLRVSPSWTRVLGIPQAELLRLHYDTLTHPDELERVRGLMADMRDRGQPARFENRVRRADGSYCWFSWVLLPEPGGRTLFGIGRDTTSERLAHQELMKQIAERERIESTLRQMQRLEAVGQLTSGVAHDFNNLLTVILGNIDRVGRGLSDPGQVRRLEMVRAAARRGANLTTQLLAFSRKQHLEPRALDLNQTLGGMEDLLRSTLGGTAQLEIVTAPDLWPALADQTQIELVVLNLAINARDATPVGGKLTICTGNAVLGPPATPSEPAPGRYAWVAVADRGTGMTPEVRERVFEPFFTTKDTGKGSGLGLAQVYGFAKQSGGGVRIETELGQGTTVTVFLPVASELSDPAPATADHPARSASRSDRLVLLVDDDAAVRDITRSVLEDAGFAVAEAPGGEAALSQLRDGLRVAAMLIDFAMPGMNGVDLARRVAETHPGIPVVILTGYADTEALGDGPSWPLVTKPYQAEQLVAALDQVLAAPG